MNELKTLKDLEQKHEWAQMYFVDTEILRQETINWIKEWKRDSIEAMRTEHYPQAMISDAKIEAFMNFFNITDEELKNDR